MLLGFLSLLLTFGTKFISKICIPSNIGDIMLPCNPKKEGGKGYKGDNRRNLLSFGYENMVWHRVLAASASGDDYCTSKVTKKMLKLLN